MTHDRPTPPLPPAGVITAAVADALRIPSLAGGRLTVAWERTALRKYVAEYHVEGRDGSAAVAVGKVYPKPERGAAAHALLEYLQGGGFATGRFTVPRPIAWLGEWRMLLVGKAPGQPLRDRLLQDPTDAGDASVAVDWLARLHACPPPDFLPEAEARATASLDRFVEELPPALTAEARQALARLLQRVAARREPPSRPALLHGDFHPLNVFVEGHGAAARACAIDVDHARVGDPAWDLGYLLGQMRDVARERFRDPLRLDDAVDAARARYLAGLPAPERGAFARRAAGHEALTLVESLHYRRCILHLPPEPDDAVLLTVGARALDAAA